MASHEEILRYQEIVEIAAAMAELGLQKIKLTGGEPLVRRGLPDLVGDLKAIPGIRQVTLTTNGVLLKEHMKALSQAGIDGINMSLDTLDRDGYRQIARRDEWDRAWEGLTEALKYPGIPLKINCVLMGQEEEELCRLGALARELPLQVRFIEMMPIGLGGDFSGKGEDEVLELLRRAFGREEPVEERLGNGPARYVHFPGFLGNIGFISAVSHKFCSSCNRVRLTSQGYLKTCLQYETGRDLREPLRRGAGREELKEIVREALMEKPECHGFFQEKRGPVDARSMVQIGG